MKKLFLLLAMILICSCAWSQKPKEIIKVKFAVVEYTATGVKEYFIENVLPESYKNYKIFILGFGNKILYQESIDSCKAGKLFSLIFFDLGQNDIYSLKVFITKKSLREKLFGVKSYPKKDNYILKNAINLKTIDGFLIERIVKI